MKADCNIDNAEKFAKWFRERGGIVRWQSQDLSWPGRSWTSPYRNEDGTLATSPHWSAPGGEHIADPAEVEVYRGVEAARFKVHLRVNMKSGYNARIELTSASSAKLRREQERLGKGSYYTFDGDASCGWDWVTVYKSEVMGTLADYMAGKFVGPKP